jgi:hypothetical protein
VQALLRGCLRNLKGWNIISDGRDLWITPLSWGSDVIIYMPSIIMFGAGIQKLMGRIHIQTHGQQIDLISLLLFFQNKESMQKN